MEFVVLGLLMLRELTIYELNQEFKQGISLFYSASYGSLQAAVKHLLEKQLVVFEERVEHGRNKKIYRITPQGREVFYAWMLEEIPPTKLEVLGLAKVYFLGLLTDPELQKRVLREIIAKIDLAANQLAQLNDELARLVLPEEVRKVAHYRIKTLGYGIGSHRFAREWFAALLREIEEGQV